MFIFDAFRAGMNVMHRGARRAHRLNYIATDVA